MDGGDAKTAQEFLFVKMFMLKLTQENRVIWLKTAQQTSKLHFSIFYTASRSPENLSEGLQANTRKISVSWLTLDPSHSLATSGF